MNPFVPPAGSRERSHRRDLRLQRCPAREQADGQPATWPGRTAAGEPQAGPPVLLAGSDPRGRAAVRAELKAALKRRTTFAEADFLAQVLERAPASRMVVLAGDLSDSSAESLIRLLSQRHPLLPVISLSPAA